MLLQAQQRVLGAVRTRRLAALLELRDEAPNTPFLLDAKRGDMDNTMRAYALAAFGTLAMDAATVNPYLGSDSIEEFTRYEDRGVYVVCRTSNPGAIEPPAPEHRRQVPLPARRRPGGDGSTGTATSAWWLGATAPAQIAEMRGDHRSAVPHPGYRSAGRRPRRLGSAAWNGDPASCLVSASRSILLRRKPGPSRRCRRRSTRSSERAWDRAPRRVAERWRELGGRTQRAWCCRPHHRLDDAAAGDGPRHGPRRQLHDRGAQGRGSTRPTRRVCRMEIVADSAERSTGSCSGPAPSARRPSRRSPRSSRRWRAKASFPRASIRRATCRPRSCSAVAGSQVENIEMDSAIAVDRKAQRAWCIVFPGRQAGHGGGGRLQGRAGHSARAVAADRDLQLHGQRGVRGETEEGAHRRTSPTRCGQVTTRAGGSSSSPGPPWSTRAPVLPVAG